MFSSSTFLDIFVKQKSMVVSPGVRSLGTCLYDPSVQWPGLGRNEREEESVLTVWCLDQQHQPHPGSC